MGYNIYIGNAKLQYDKDNEYITADVESATCEDAPDFGFGDISGKSNGRFPSYSTMSDFCKIAGIYNLFYDKEDGLIRSHPGCKVITDKHLKQIVVARKEWESKFPDCVDKIPYKDKEPSDIKLFDHIHIKGIAKRYDWIYARLLWFEFWFNWALKNCDKPAIANG